jgi:hypothetical protein
LDLKKYPKKYTKNIPHFLGVGDDFNYEKNPINQNIYIIMFTTSILRCLKKNPNICKNISHTFKYLKFIFQIATSFRSNSSIASSFLKHDYNNLTFEIHANNILKIVDPIF